MLKAYKCFETLCDFFSVKCHVDPSKVPVGSTVSVHMYFDIDMPDLYTYA